MIDPDLVSVGIVVVLALAVVLYALLEAVRRGYRAWAAKVMRDAREDWRTLAGPEDR